MGTGPKLLLAAGLCCLSVSPAGAEVVADIGLGDAALTAAVDATSASAASETGTDGAQTSDAASPPEHDSGWQFSAAPYLWLAGMKGDLGVVEAVEPVGVDFSFLETFWVR